MMESEKVDVVLTTFNRASTITGSLSSVLNQSCSPQKVVVVDDGSSDNTAELLKGFGERIDVLRQANKGIAIARNNGISRTSGEWIAFQDSDDEWYPFKLKLQINVMKALPQVKLIFTDVDAVGELGKFPRKITGEFSDFQSRFGLGKNEFFPHSVSLRELGIIEDEIDPGAKVYYGPIFQHMWVNPFIINSTVLMRHDSVIPYPPDSSLTDAKFYVELSQHHWFAYLDVPTLAYSVYGKEEHMSGPQTEGPRFSKIVEAHQYYYGKGENLIPSHRKYYKRQMAFYLHRIALYDLYRFNRKRALANAVGSIKVIWQQIPAYLILGLSLMPKFFLKWIQRRRQAED